MISDLCRCLGIVRNPRTVLETKQCRGLREIKNACSTLEDNTLNSQPDVGKKNGLDMVEWTRTSRVVNIQVIYTHWTLLRHIRHFCRARVTMSGQRSRARVNSAAAKRRDYEA